MFIGFLIGICYKSKVVNVQDQKVEDILQQRLEEKKKASESTGKISRSERRRLEREQAKSSKADNDGVFGIGEGGEAFRPRGNAGGMGINYDDPF